MAQPRACLVIMTYNQAGFVREALQSAFAQDYSPLEILISDDHSYDGTWDIIEEMADAYDGPHAIRLNRNDKRLSVNHRNRLIELVGDQLFVLGAGDDIYMPHRVSRLVARHLETGALAVSSPAHKIDAEGRHIGEHPPKHIRELAGDCSLETFLRAKLIPTMFGAGLMWSPELVETFGPIPDGPRNSDEIMPFRACLLGKADYVAEPLLYWRKHDRNMTLQYQEAQAEGIEARVIREREMQNKIANFTAFIQDTVTLDKKNGPSQRTAQARNELASHLIWLTSQHMKLRHELASAGWGVL